MNSETHWQRVIKSFSDAGLKLLSESVSYDVFEVLGDSNLTPQAKKVILASAFGVETQVIA